MDILVLQHVDCEPPAAYLPLLAARGTVRTVRLGVDPLPGHHDFGAIVAMGGPMGVGDAATIGWIDEEVSYIRGAVAEGVPYWGVCLGAQLLAAALGARVSTGRVPEVGMGEVTLTAGAAGDPVFRGLPERFPVLQWHSDTFDLPPGAVLLASSDAYPHQAFAAGSAYGLQFHLECSPALVREWQGIEAYRQSLASVLGPDGPAIMLDGLRAVFPVLERTARTVLTNWLDAYLGVTAR
jgi:GMP synthase (glutamine-hydrolysing)